MLGIVNIMLNKMEEQKVTTSPNVFQSLKGLSKQGHMFCVLSDGTGDLSLYIYGTLPGGDPYVTDFGGNEIEPLYRVNDVTKMNKYLAESEIEIKAQKTREIVNQLSDSEIVELLGEVKFPEIG